MKMEDLPPSFRKASLEGKVAVVTGSTQGLGEATARLFCERGCSGLVLTGRSSERGNSLANELTTDSCKTVFVQADLEDMEAVRNIFVVADRTFGTVHILVNAAATTDRGSIWDTTPEDYDRIMNVNTRAPFFLMQDAARIMEREKVAGSIINISSTASYGSMPMLAAYGMSKGALNVATKNAAYSLMWSKIRVNALAIGWMDTPGEDAIQRKVHCSSEEENWKQEGEANQPFGRLLKPDEVARCIAFCASEESGMMTGCVIDFDQSVWGAGNAPVPPRKEEWARANGMTFSFQDETQSKNLKTKMSKPEDMAPPPPPPPLEDGKESRKSTPRSSTRKSPKSSSRKSTPRSTPKSSPRAGMRKQRSRDDLMKKTKASPKESPRVRNKASINASPDTAYILSASRAKMGKRPQPPVSSVVIGGEEATESESEQPFLWIPDISESRPDDDMEKEIKDISPVTPQEELTNITKKELPVELPYPDDARPDPEEFKRMLKERNDNEEIKLDDYLPGTDPFVASRERAELAKQKFGGSQDSSQDSSQPSYNADYLPPAISPKPPKPKALKIRSPVAAQRKLQGTKGPIRPQDFFAENSPIGKKKERGNKKPLSRSSDHGDYRSARVADWLGGDAGKNQRRSYKVKKVRNLVTEEV